ncbi:MAG: hypothetical protein GWP60_02225 [Gammaproteobacteria bacterium]|jgi:hypothetical protein|nr:hypothetical protein [Gammaproteobacteria bacterium]
MPEFVTILPQGSCRLSTKRLNLLRISLAVWLAVFLNTTAADGLRVDNAAELAFAVTDMTSAAQGMGLSKAGLAGAVTEKLGAAGILARPTISGQDEEVLLVDVVIEHDAYYVSLGFWRVASYPQPQGGITSSFVTVWQDYSVGTHHGNADTVYDAVTTIADQFIARYSDANDLAGRVRAANSP